MRLYKEDHSCGKGAFTNRCHPQMPLRFQRTSQSLLERLVSFEHQQDMNVLPLEAMKNMFEIAVD